MITIDFVRRPMKFCNRQQRSKKKFGQWRHFPGIEENLGDLKVIPRKKGAPRIFAHYHKIFNFCPIFMKLGGNNHLMS